MHHVKGQPKAFIEGFQLKLHTADELIANKTNVTVSVR